jgi:hypothetical protein
MLFMNDCITDSMSCGDRTVLTACCFLVSCASARSEVFFPELNAASAREFSMMSSNEMLEKYSLRFNNTVNIFNKMLKI